MSISLLTKSLLDGMKWVARTDFDRLKVQLLSWITKLALAGQPKASGQQNSSYSIARGSPTLLSSVLSP